MEDSKHTPVCTFDPKSPRMSAFELHEWIHEQLQVDDAKVTMVQIDGPKRQAYVCTNNSATHYWLCKL
jgi:hypothetical protein